MNDKDHEVRTKIVEGYRAALKGMIGYQKELMVDEHLCAIMFISATKATMHIYIAVCNADIDSQNEFFDLLGEIKKDVLTGSDN